MELRDKIKELIDDSRRYKEELRRMNEINGFFQTKVKKGEMQKELLSKDIASSLDNLSLISKSYKYETSSFADVVSNCLITPLLM
jgi:hypothetical protein